MLTTLGDGEGDACGLADRVLTGRVGGAVVLAVRAGGWPPGGAVCPLAGGFDQDEGAAAARSEQDHDRHEDPQRPPAAPALSASAVLPPIAATPKSSPQPPQYRALAARRRPHSGHKLMRKPYLSRSMSTVAPDRR
jgi:hypothetical protein